jgi:predicted metal-dependent peptidase
MLDKITKAKSVLVMDHPFWASLLLSMPMTEDSSIETAATDGFSVTYNPEWLGSKSLGEIIFVLGHEVGHGILDHCTRRGDRDPAGWNAAADYVLNSVLVRDKVGTMPKEGLLDHNLVDSCAGSVEAVYAALAQNQQNQQQQSQSQGQGQGKGQSGRGKPGQSQGQSQGQGNASAGQFPKALDQIIDVGKDEAEKSQKRAEMRARIVQAANAARMQGKLSAGLERLVGEMTRAKVDWRAVLRRFITERAKVDYSFARPNRRFLADDMILPSLNGEKMGCIAVFFDCSGSVDDATGAALASEVRAIIEDVAPGLLLAGYFDAVVLKTQTFGPDDTFEFTPMGGGGTMFSPIWESIAESNLDPVCCVVLTDLVCSDFGKAPHYPVLWATVGADQAPFGEVVRIEE